MPCFLVLERLVKNETVTGIIGNTQGVIKAIKPPRKPSNNNSQGLELLLVVAVAAPQASLGASVASVGNNI